ncbi:DNA recombination protein RmuC [Arcanobacterium bovis]|uniref:DNA recombination protein RmuC n=1 Tax=Arcanobacterium bovis TaxID=2529275 RepID=A0A4Q9V260_9ACTO|nr:DNA recombination protein RmuC [Arcanobacterium bovis]TBW23690.1 DNA recombination protein RmuC [Arcanobacterium bovis]
MTINIPVLMLLLLLTAIAGGLGGYSFAHSRARSRESELSQQLSASREQLLITSGKLERLETENTELIERFGEDSSILQVLSPIVKQLDDVNQQVQRLDQRTIAHNTQVLTHLQNDARVQAELSHTTASLNAALRSTSARGNWGEVQLKRLVEAAGMLERVDFDVQTTSAKFAFPASSSATAAPAEKSRLRPDAIIHLPGGGHIAIDAKTPMDAFLRAQEIDASQLAGAQERNELLKKHAKAVQSHIQALVKRNYPGDFPDSPQITVMFLPSEGLLAEALEADAALLESALRTGIVPTSPSSLLALLRAVASVWSSAAASEEAREIVNLGRTLVERLNTVVKHLGSLGKSLGSSVDSYNKAIASLESRVLVTARKFDSLDTQALEIAPPPAQLATSETTIRLPKELA